MQKPMVEHGNTVARINVTPIIDVALVLVIILLITAPMITVSDMNVNLPPAHTRSVEDEVRVSVTLNAEGDVAIDDDLVHRSNLIKVLRARFDALDNDKVLLVVRADSGTPYQSIRSLIEDAREAGARRIAIATQQRRHKS